MKYWINWVFKRAGLQIVRSASVQKLLDDVSQLQAREAEQGATIAALNGQLAETNARIGDLSSANASLAAEVQELYAWLRRSMSAHAQSRRQVDRLQAQLDQAQLALGTTSSEGVPSIPIKSKVVVVVTTVSQVPQLKALAGATKISETYDFIVVAYFDVRASAVLDFCVENGIALLDHKCEVVCGDEELSFLLVPDKTEHAYFGWNASLGEYDAEDKRLLQRTNELLGEVHWQNGIGLQADRFLRRLRPSALVLFEDNAAYHTGVWVAVSRRNDIPAVVLPYAIIDPGDAAEAYFNNPGYWAEDGAFNRFVKSALPHWAFSYRDRWLLRRSATGALASEVLGFAQPQPWVWNSTRADMLAVESEAMRDVYRAQGVLRAQIEVTGSLADDLLCEALQNADAIRRQLDLDAQRPTLVCGFPPNQLNVNRPDPEFDDFKTIVDRWLGEFAKLDGWQIVIKPHPAMNPGDVAYLRTFPFPVTDLDTTSLIAICDLFNTSVSSTIRWALACGKPVLNYDVYRYRYRDFMDEPAVLTVFDFEAFSSQLARLTGERSALTQLTEIARASSGRWGMLDGQSGARIAKLFDRLTGRLPASSVSSDIL